MRVKFETSDTVNLLPFSSANPDLPKGEVPYMPYGDELRYAIYGTLQKSGIRRAGLKVVVAQKRKLDPTYKMDIDTLRLGAIGGVKGSGASAHPNPAILEEVRRLNPHLELFGSGAPAMTGGCVIMGIMTSATKIRATPNNFGKIEFDKNTRLPIIRRSLLNDPSVNVNDIADPEKMMGDAVQNRKRSQATKDIETWRKLEIKQRKEPLKGRDQGLLTTAKANLTEHFGTAFERIEDAIAALEAFKSGMVAGGTADVAEANLHSVVVVPANTVWRHTFELHHPSMTAIGLFMEAWNHKTTFNPYIGGNIARGCGGYLHGTYEVSRQENDNAEWVHDCHVEVRPDEGVIVTGSNDSLIHDAWQAWKTVDITKYVFDFAEIQRILNEGSE